MTDRQFDCTRCGKKHLTTRVVWLSLDSRTNLFYETLPVGAIDQGGFAFGATCAKRELARTKYTLLGFYGS